MKKTRMILNSIDEAIISLLSTLKIVLNCNSAIFFLYNKNKDHLFIESGISSEEIKFKKDRFKQGKLSLFCCYRSKKYKRQFFYR